MDDTVVSVVPPRTSRAAVFEDGVRPANAAGLSIGVFARFHPSVGGIEVLSDLLARQWVAAGHRVTVVTDVPPGGADEREFPFEVIRRPGPLALVRVLRACDVVVHQNISLKALWPLSVVRRPLIAVHQSWYATAGERPPLREKLKLWLARNAANNIFASEAIQRRLACGGVVIANPYDHHVFRQTGLRRSRDVAFVGRLVPDKGVAVLLHAFVAMKRHGEVPQLTIVGDGPERAAIERQVHESGLSGQVTLAGQQNSREIAKTLNEHSLLVVPSVWEEPFGIVALEGAACGCVVVGSRGGGLPEAIGPCGVTFNNRDYNGLAAILSDLLRDAARRDQFRQAAAAHLRKHRADVVAGNYIDFFRRVLQWGRTNLRSSDIS